MTETLTATDIAPVEPIEYADLLELSGFAAANQGDSKVLFGDQAEILKQRLLNWLPNWLDTHQLDISGLTVGQPTWRKLHLPGRKLMAWETNQEWGDKPSPLAIKEAGPVVEFAGPTQNRDSMSRNYGLKPDLVTNVSENAGLGPVDMLADVRQMPFAEGSLGGIFISCLPGMPRQHATTFDISHQESTLRDEAIVEAARVLKPGGFLFWRGGTTEDVDAAWRNGLEPRHFEVEAGLTYNPAQDEYAEPDLRIGMVFEKPVS